MKHVFLILMLAFSGLASADEVNWVSYEEARALNSDKPIFVFAKMRFCGTCAKMEEDEFSDPELAKLLNESFIPVKETVNFAFSKFVFDDLKDKNGNTLKFSGFPSVMLVMGNNYSINQGYVSAEMLKTQLARVTNLGS